MNESPNESLNLGVASGIIHLPAEHFCREKHEGSISFTCFDLLFLL